MEPVLRSFLFCESVVPAPSGKMNCYGLFSDLFAGQFPFTQPRFSLLLSWGGGRGFQVQVVKMLNPAKTALLHQSPEMYFTLEDESQSAHVQIDMNQIVFTEAGSYIFQIMLHGRQVAEHRLNVHQL
ncbi:hypothetical protein ABS71_11420 [bacterium SCN 62-11]|nr:MAG: hypothetical protein ABS71_11420 [bacterium SCN 62-11]